MFPRMKKKKKNPKKKRKKEKEKTNVLQKNINARDGRVDASKVPPSRFQKRKGSIYAVPGSRDGHVDSNYAAKFHQKHAEMGYGRKGR